MPKVSIIIPSYNHSRFLAERLDSVLAQTYRDFEVIFLDDASPDDSLAVFERYRGHPQIRAIINEVNSGCTFKQWNKGVREARGEYIWLAESDDSCEPTLLESLVPILDARPEVGLAYCNSLMFDEEGRPVGDVHDWVDPLHPTRWRDDFVADGREECRRYLVQRNTIPNASAVVFRKAVYELVGGADERTRLCGDWLMWAKLLLESDVAYIAHPLNRFRVPHAGSVRHRTSRKMLYLEEWFAVIKIIEDKAGLSPEVRERVLSALGDEWLRSVRGTTPDDAMTGGRRVLEPAQRAGSEYWLALLSASMIESIRATGPTAELVRRCEDLNAEVRSQMRFWERLRGIVLPRGGLLHRAAHALNRIRKRCATRIRPRIRSERRS